MRKLICLSILGMLGLFGCHTHDHDHAHAGHEVEAVAVTQWTEKMEIFMEYDQAVVGHEIKFIIHLTNLTDFQPVREGKVVLNFKQTSGADIVVEKDELLREGIFTPTKTFDMAGEYRFSLSYKGEKTNEIFDIGVFRVYSGVDELPPAAEAAAGEAITFLKEQQWKMDFATEKAQLRPLKSAVNAVGTVRPRPASYAEIISPVEGIISIASSEKLVKPGQKVTKGQTMAVLVPPLAAQDSWAKIYLDYEQASAEYDRAKRLQERNAISEREFEQARRNYEMHKAGFSNYFESDESTIRFDSENQTFYISAPISGTVADAAVLPGQKVEQNQKLFSIINPDMVWLQIDLFAEQVMKLNEISGASIRIPGREQPVNLNRQSLTLISRGEMVDPTKRTITLWLEAGNRDRQFLIGQIFSAQIYTSPEQEMLAIPQAAVYEDNSQKIVFVHASGESFEKREVTTGPTYHNYVAILNGLSAGERVVTRGGYQVKLASTSEEIGHPHTH